MNLKHTTTNARQKYAKKNKIIAGIVKKYFEDTYEKELSVFDDLFEEYFKLIDISKQLPAIFAKFNANTELHKCKNYGEILQIPQKIIVNCE